MRGVSFLTAAVIVLAVAVASSLPPAEAFDVHSSGTFSLPSLGGTADVYDDSRQHLGIRISVTSGSVKVQSVGQTIDVLGTVGANQACVFEGTYSHIRVSAAEDGTAGSYENLEVSSGGGDADGIVGTCTGVQLSGTPVRVYRSDASGVRALFITVSSGTVGIRTSSGGADILTVEAGDSAAVDGTFTEYYLSGTGTATAQAQKPDETSNWTDWKDVTGHADNDEDPLDKPTSDTCYEYEIENTGNQANGKITIMYKLAGESFFTEEEIDPGDPFSFDCDMEKVKVKFEKDGGKMRWRKRKQV